MISLFFYTFRPQHRKFITYIKLNKLCRLLIFKYPYFWKFILLKNVFVGCDPKVAERNIVGPIPSNQSVCYVFKAGISVQKRSVLSTFYYKTGSQSFLNNLHCRRDQTWKLPGPKDHVLWALSRLHSLNIVNNQKQGIRTGDGSQV